MTAAIEQALLRLVRRWRRVAAVRAALAGVSAAGLFALLVMGVDRWAHLSPRLRATSDTVVVLVCIATAWRVGRLLTTRRFDADRAASLAEAADAAWGERMSTLVTQSALPVDRRGSPAMLAALAAGVEAELPLRPPAARVTLSAARPAGFFLAGVVALWLAAFAVPVFDGPALLARLIRPFAGLPPVTSTRIELQPHVLAVEQGQSLAIVADIDGKADAVLWVGPDRLHLSAVAMDRSYGRRFTATLPALQDDFIYRVTAGDASAGPVTVRVLRKPGLARIDVTLSFPDGRTPTTLAESDGRLRVPAGTRVGISFIATEPLRSANVRINNSLLAATADRDGRTWRAAFTATATGDWAIDLVSRRGVSGAGPAGMRVRVDRAAASQPF